MKLTNSKKIFEKAKRFIPGGVNSPVRAFGAVGGSPVFIRRGKGARIFDVDGNSYIDYVLSWGPLILGHTHPSVVRAVKGALREGTSFGASTDVEVKFAQIITRAIPSIEKVRLVNSGTEATMSAVRLARGYTGRDKIIKFEGCYHGSVDSLLVKAGSGGATFGVPTSKGVTFSVARDTLICPYNDVDEFWRIVKRYHRRIAACIVEPVCGNMGVVVPENDFLLSLREITRKYNIVLIFDEVITGFRFCFGGVQNIFKVYPDITCLGKIIGGGFPIGAYGGRKEIMDCLSPQGQVYQAGTLSGNPVAVSAGVAVLTELAHLDYTRLEEKTKYLCDKISKVLSDKNIDFCLNRFGSMFTVFFTSTKVVDFKTAKTADTKRYAVYFWEMLKRGVYLTPSQFEANFISFVHNERHLQYTVDSLINVLAKGI